MSSKETIELIVKALNGDAEATRKYCGSYCLVASHEGKLYRVSSEVKIPEGYIYIRDVYDEDGYLVPFFWSLPRFGIEK